MTLRCARKGRNSLPKKNEHVPQKGSVSRELSSPDMSFFRGYVGFRECIFLKIEYNPEITTDSLQVAPSPCQEWD